MQRNTMTTILKSVLGISISSVTMLVLFSICGFSIESSSLITGFLYCFAWCAFAWIPLMFTQFVHKRFFTVILGVLCGCTCAVPFFVVKTSGFSFTFFLFILLMMAMPYILMKITYKIWEKIQKWMQYGFRVAMKMMVRNTKLFMGYGLTAFVASAIGTAAGLKMIAPILGYNTQNFLSGILERLLNMNSNATLYDYFDMVTVQWVAIESVIVGIFCMIVAMNYVCRKKSGQTVRALECMATTGITLLAGVGIGSLSMLLMHVLSAVLFVGVVLPLIFKIMSEIPVIEVVDGSVYQYVGTTYTTRGEVKVYEKMY